MTMFDIGQGDALLVRWGQECMWVDFGTPFAATVRTPVFFREYKQCKSSQFVITHRDLDHMGGFFVLRELLDIKHPIMERRTFSGSPQIEWLWPIGDPIMKRENDNSIVLRIWDIVHKHCALLTADITQAVETILIRSPNWKKCDILKVAHHGSHTSTSKEFLQAMNPRVALISSGWKNSYGHPHSATLEKLKVGDMWIFRTDWMGRIDLDLKDNEVDIATARGKVRIKI